MKSRIVRLLPCLLLLGCLSAAAGPITPAGHKLSTFLTGMDVESHWIAGQPIDWLTGDFDPDSTQQSTHCSAFAAAACERLGIYLLCPPEHGQTLLSDAQYRWLAKSGPAYGWTRLPGPMEAQDAANQGLLVLASVINPIPKKPGHIAIVRPAVKTAEQIKLDGPEVIQAGERNWNRVTARVGFINHQPAFQDGLIAYYAHATSF